MTATEFPDLGLSDAQREHIHALARSLDARQLLWASGFLAGAAQGQDAAAARVAAAGLPPGTPGARKLTILYGSETGNSSALAATLVQEAIARGLAASAYDMAVYKTRQLKDEQDLLLIASTYGEGDPPQPAAGFFEFIEGRKAPKLPGLRFAVLALGDTTYEFFCEAGKRLDSRLQELGATRLQARIDCDVDYDEAAQAWISGILGMLGEARATAGTNLVELATAPITTTVFDKRKPFAARILDNLVLTGRGSSKETRHVEISLEGSGLTFEPGDALGIVPGNDPAVIQAILSGLELDAATPVTVKGNTVALGDALASGLEITTLTPRFLDHWAMLSGSAALKRLAQPDQGEERKAFAHGHHIVDVIRQFPVKGMTAPDFIAGLRPLQPRLYSVASSAALDAQEVHLTISTVRYDLHGERRSGVASGHLADRGGPDALLPVYVQQNPHFRLPADDVPIIMIGAGTGVAPYRAFMQEREARSASGWSWLFFGERNFRTDFLYQTEWQGLLKDGILTRMDVAFSRDERRDNGGKVYVQQRLREHARDIFDWLEQGAHVYVCGDANRLAPDVHQALAAIVTAQGGFGPAATQDYMQRLQSDQRYQRDVY